MATQDPQFVRFLKQECSRLKDENELLADEVSALRRYLRALQDFQETVHDFSPEQDVLALLDETMVYALKHQNLFERLQIPNLSGARIAAPKWKVASDFVNIRAAMARPRASRGPSIRV